MTITQTTIDEKYIKDLLSCIDNPDKKKIKALLRNFHQANSGTRARGLFEISSAQDQNVLFILDFLIKEASPSTDQKNDLIELVLDKARGNAEFIILFSEVADIRQLREATPLFANILVSETDTHILHETIKAIGKTRERSCINLLADFIFYDHEELKHAAVNALGNIGGPSVIKRLAFASSTSKSDPYIVETLNKLTNELNPDTKPDDGKTEQFASRKDTLGQLTDDSDITQLLKMLNSSSPHDRHTAIDLLIEMGVQAIPAVAENINLTSPDSIINALDILGNTEHEAALPAVLKILNINHPDSNVRFSAHEAISKLPAVKSTVSLFEGLTDSSEQVRIAAATAININLSDVLIAGIKSKIETSGRSSQKKIIVASIIDSHSGNIFSSLLDSDSFVFLATDYLSMVHDATLTFFIHILEKRGSKLLARSIKENIKRAANNTNLTIYVVDDSEVTLKYHIKLFHSMGHTPIAFTNPDEALEAISDNKPDLLTTDLNMLNMNGLQLTAKIRATYNSKEMPVVIITTQSDFVEGTPSAGSTTLQGSLQNDTMLNLVLKKPLTNKEIKPLLDKIIEPQNG